MYQSVEMRIQDGALVERDINPPHSVFFSFLCISLAANSQNDNNGTLLTDYRRARARLFRRRAMWIWNPECEGDWVRKRVHGYQGLNDGVHWV